MSTEWKSIPNYPMYKIGNDGTVISMFNNKIRIRKPICVHGYYYVNLNKNNIYKRFAIHRLVAEAFIPNPDNKPQVDHIDGDKSNNEVSNLRWVTPSENLLNSNTYYKWQEHLVGHYAGLGRFGSKHPLSKPVERIDINGNIKSYECIEETVRDGFKKSGVSQCCRGIKSIYRGYIWRFKDSTNKDSIDLKKEIAKTDWPVWKKDPDGNVTYYENVSLAVKEGYSKKYIYQCCKNSHKKHRSACIHWSWIPFT